MLAAVLAHAATSREKQIKSEMNGKCMSGDSGMKWFLISTCREQFKSDYHAFVFSFRLLCYTLQQKKDEIEAAGQAKQM